MKTTCIMCPLGCELDIEVVKGGEIKVSGNTCIRGEQYAKAEMTHPTRNISSLVRVGERVVPVKSSAPIPKNKIDAVLNEISKVKLTKMPPIQTVIIKNVLGLGVDIISIGY